MTTSYESNIVSLMSYKRMELFAKGYTSDQVDAAIKRSRHWAHSMCTKLPTHMRDEAFLSFFEDSLKGAEEWLDSMKSALT